MGKNLRIEIREALLKGPLAGEVRRLRLFGSYLHGEQREDSALDLLVEFKAESHIGFFKLAGLEESLASSLNRRVDLLTPQQLSPYFMDEVLVEAEVIYEG